MADENYNTIHKILSRQMMWQVVTAKLGQGNLGSIWSLSGNQDVTKAARDYNNPDGFDYQALETLHLLSANMINSLDDYVGFEKDMHVRRINKEASYCVGTPRFYGNIIKFSGSLPEPDFINLDFTAYGDYAVTFPYFMKRLEIYHPDWTPVIAITTSLESRRVKGGYALCGSTPTGPCSYFGTTPHRAYSSAQVQNLRQALARDSVSYSDILKERVEFFLADVGLGDWSIVPGGVLQYDTAGIRTPAMPCVIIAKQ